MILDCIWTLTRLDVIVKSIPQTDRKFVCVTSRSCENPFSRVWKTITKSLGKNWKSKAFFLQPWTWWTSVTSFIKIVQAIKKLNSIFRAGLNFRRRPFLCRTLYRNIKQAGNFGGPFYQLFLCIFLWNFHRRCLSTFSIPWCKKVKNDQKLKSRGPALRQDPPWFGFLVIFDFFCTVV